MNELDLDIYLKNSLKKSGDEHFFLKSGKSIEAQITKILDDNPSIKTNVYFIQNNDDFDSNGLVFSLTSRINSNINIKYARTLAQKANLKFKKTNVTAKIKNHADCLYVVSSAYLGYERLKDEYSSLLYANDSIKDASTQDEKRFIRRDKNIKSFIEEYVDSTVLDIKIALLGTSLFLDEAILDDILSKEDE